jgi:hypothetical protein
LQYIIIAYQLMRNPQIILIEITGHLAHDSGGTLWLNGASVEALRSLGLERPSAGPFCRLKLSAQLMMPT